MKHFFLMGDPDVRGRNGFLKEFCDPYNLKSLIKFPACFKNSDFPTSIDVIFTTLCRGFHNSCAIETGLADFHKTIVTCWKHTFKKRNLKSNSIWRL